MFLESQLHDFDAIAHAGGPLRMSVQNFMEIVWTVSGNLKFSLKGREKKRQDCISISIIYV